MRIPLTLDLSIHAVPTIALTLDFFLFEVKYSVKTARVGGAGVVALAAVLYGSWVEYCASYNGKCKWAVRIGFASLLDDHLWMGCADLCLVGDSPVPVPNEKRVPRARADIRRVCSLRVRRLPGFERSPLMRGGIHGTGYMTLCSHKYASLLLPVILLY